MAFKATYEIVDRVGKVTLEGKLDTVATHQFQVEVDKMINADLRTLLVYVKDLVYISSATLRVFVYARQKLGPKTEIILVSPQQQILDIFRMVGLEGIITIVDAVKE